MAEKHEQTIPRQPDRSKPARPKRRKAASGLVSEVGTARPDAFVAQLERTFHYKVFFVSSLKEVLGKLQLGWERPGDADDKGVQRPFARLHKVNSGRKGFGPSKSRKQQLAEDIDLIFLLDADNSKYSVSELIREGTELISSGNDLTANVSERPNKLLNELMEETAVPKALWAALRIEVFEVLDKARKHSQSILNPGARLPDLSRDQINAIKQRGRMRPWKSRARHRMSCFEWVRDNYGEWIPGLTQEHLLMADKDLHAAFRVRVSREGGRPSWLDVPTRGEANLRAIPDPGERLKRVLMRESVKQRMRQVRSLD